MFSQARIDKADHLALRIELDNNGCWKQPLFDNVLAKIEQIESAISWCSGNKPTMTPRQCGGLLGAVPYIKFTKVSKRLSITDSSCNNQGSACYSFVTSQKFLDAITSSIATVTTSPTAMKDRIVDPKPWLPISQPKSIWNCTCANCNGNAYQSPFSFECENGCKDSLAKGVK